MSNSIFGLLIIGLFFSGCEDVQKYIKAVEFLEKQNIELQAIDKEVQKKLGSLEKQNIELQAINQEVQKKLDSYENRTNNIRKNMFNPTNTN